MSRMYTSLHNHSYFSVLDALSRPMDMAKLAKQMGMPAMALTDHGNMYGVPEFVDACTEVGIKPIIGVEAYMVPDIKVKAEFITPAGKKSRSGYHIILLAKNLKGYQNLVKLMNIAATEGFYYYPKIDWDSLMAHREGLIVTSACLSGELAQATLSGSPTTVAPPVAQKFKDAFGDDYYIEVMENSMVNDVQRNVNRRVIATSKNVGVKVIPTCDSHYPTLDMQPIHDIVLCIKDKKSMSDPERFHYDGLYHLKSPEEMAGLFPEFMANTMEIAEKIEAFTIFDKTLRLPTSDLEPNMLLRGLAEAGLRERNLDSKPDYVARLNRELETIEACNFAPYFIATRSIITIINRLKCPVGWGRGSAGGSLVCYVLGITDIDPIKWGLLFERFVNRTRPDQPDIDIDVPQGRRQEVITKIFENFGTDKVAHISTYHCFKPKLLIKDICRALDEPAAVGDALAKQIPHDAEMLSDIQFKENTNPPEETKFWQMVRQMEKGEVIVKALVTLLATDKDSHKDSKTTVGAPRQIGTHASGIVISSVPIKNHLPIRMDKDKMATVYDMHHVDRFGFLKFDILGLRTIDIIYATAADAGIDLKMIPLDDKATYDLISSGRVVGVFQFEASKSYIDLCRKMKPVNIKEVFDLCALHRPGVMDSDQVNVYLRRRAGLEPVTYVHPALKSTLEGSYGISIFQEDMMKLAVEYAGYDPVEAENLRRAISKKIQAVMDSHKAGFIQKSKALGRDNPEEVWKIVEAGARYNWNKAHSVGYGFITYASAYLSANYPLQFFKNLITFSEPDKKPTYLSEAIGRKLKVLPPDVNRADKDVTIEKDGIRLGLLSVKGIGDAIADKIIAGRPYRTIAEAQAKLSKGILATMYAINGVESIPDAATFTPIVKGDEAELLGISLKSMAGEYTDLIKKIKAQAVHDIQGSAPAVIKVLDVKEVTDRRGRKMAWVTGVDAFGPIVDGMPMFADAYSKGKPKKGQTYAMILSSLPNGGHQINRIGTPEEVMAA